MKILKISKGASLELVSVNETVSVTSMRPKATIPNKLYYIKIEKCTYADNHNGFIASIYEHDLDTHMTRVIDRVQTLTLDYATIYYGRFIASF